MTRPNGHNDNGDAGLLERTEDPGIVGGPLSPSPPEPFPEVATRAKQRAKQQLHQNRFVIVAAGAIVTALLIFVAVSVPHRNAPQKTKNRGATVKGELTGDIVGETDEKSLFPITDSGRPPAKTRQGFLSERDLQRTVVRSGVNVSPASASGAETLGAIKPFGDKWEAPPYETSSTTADAPEMSKTERDAMDKPSLTYVRKVSPNVAGIQSGTDRVPELGLGLATGTRLRAHLESAASTAVRAPVLAVIEYNYDRGGEIIVPAGAQAVGRIRQANRSGYVDLEFDSLLMPDGASVPIEAAATGLDLRPLKGRVEGKNTGKNLLVRSLSGIGQAGSLFLGQGNLNQPLSESDLMRERVASNIGETGDEAVSRVAVNQQIAVTVSAGMPIYVVLQQSPKSSETSAAPSVRTPTAPGAANTDKLRELLQLQQELDQPTASNRSPQ